VYQPTVGHRTGCGYARGPRARAMIAGRPLRVRRKGAVEPHRAREQRQGIQRRIWPRTGREWFRVPHPL